MSKETSEWNWLATTKTSLQNVLLQNFHLSLHTFTPWPNGLASRRKFWTCVQLAFRLTTHGLALNLVELKFGRKFFLPFGHPAQVDTSWSQVICCYENALINDISEICGFLRLEGRLANPFGHPSQAHTQVLVLQNCVDLRRRASPFGQGFRFRRQFRISKFTSFSVSNLTLTVKVYVI